MNMKARMLAFCVIAVVSLGALADEKKPAAKDTAIIRDESTGRLYEVKVPRDAVEVKQTGPNTRDVKVNSEATRKIEVRDVTPEKDDNNS